MDDVVLQAFAEHPVGVLFGVGFCILCLYIGLALLFNGWPKSKK